VIREIEVPGARLHAVDDGEGPPIVLLHAGVADLTSWDELVPLLTRAGYRFVRYDLRGFGRTVIEDVEYSNRADVVAVLDAFGIERAALVGNSHGGNIAFDTAIEFPERVAAVIVVGAGLGGFDNAPTESEAALFDEMQRLEEARPPDAEAAADLAVRIWVDGPTQPAGRVPETIRSRVHNMVVASYAPGQLVGRPIPLEPPANDRLDEVRCPVLAVVGEHDTTFIHAVGRRLEEAVPGARTVVVPDVAHMVGMEAPHRLAELIVELLDPLRPWT
jgi:pimeloyl-ACP methyl ester carboxylesterase